MRQSIEVRCWPRADREFAAEVERVVAEAQPHTDEQGIELVAAALRERHPNIRIAPRSPFGALESSAEVWYVYRDGDPIAGR